MKIILEILLSLVLHPVALVLAWINIATRTDITTSLKIVWAAAVFFVPIIGPIVYVVAGGGELW